MTRAQLLAFAEGLVLDADDQRRYIEATQPAREPLARLILDDAVKVYFLIESCRKLCQRRKMEIKSRLVRADLLTQALRTPVQ